MTNLIKTTLLAASILAGASVGYAADGIGNNKGGATDQTSIGDPHGNEIDNQELRTVDPAPTGSILPCDSGTYDVDGNCVMEPDMQ